MQDSVSVSVDEIKNMPVLGKEEIKNLSFDELCLYLGILDTADSILKECGENE